MKALVWEESGAIELREVDAPTIEDPTDAVVRITTTAICGTDLHLVRGTMPPMSPGTILGHEGVGVVESLGSGVRNLVEGDRVVIPSSIACGTCSYCRRGWTAQCDTANPKGPRAGSVFFGGPENTGPFAGLQAEKARVPFAHFNLVKLPDGVSDDQGILISDTFPTGYFGAELAEIEAGQSVAVLGCGPVGLFSIASAKLMGAGRIFAVDGVADRLEQARRLGAEVIDYQSEDPVEALLELTGGIGVDCTIEAVGIDAYHPSRGPAAGNGQLGVFEQEAEAVFGATRSDAGWHPGDAPSLSLRWSVEMLAKQGVASIIGGFPANMNAFPIGLVFNRNLSVRAGIVHHRMVIPKLIELVVSGRIDPVAVLAPSVEATLDGIEEAYRRFDRRDGGWTKVALVP